MSVILISPYDSIANVAKEVHPYLPVDLLLKHRFDSISRAPSIKIPLYVLYGTNDVLIKPWRSIALAEKWGGKVQIQEISGANHESIVESPACWGYIKLYLESFGD
jgi:hypothetical protein